MWKRMAGAVGLAYRKETQLRIDKAKILRSPRSCLWRNLVTAGQGGQPCRAGTSLGPDDLRLQPVLAQPLCASPSPRTRGQ